MANQLNGTRGNAPNPRVALVIQRAKGLVGSFNQTGGIGARPGNVANSLLPKIGGIPTNLNPAQALAKAKGLVGSIRNTYNFNGQNAFGTAGKNPAQVLASAQGALRYAQQFHHVKISNPNDDRRLNSAQNLEAILAEGNRPVDPRQARLESFAFFDGIIKDYMAKYTDVNNSDAKAIEELRQARFESEQAAAEGDAS